MFTNDYQTHHRDALSIKASIFKLPTLKKYSTCIIELHITHPGMHLPSKSYCKSIYIQFNFVSAFSHVPQRTFKASQGYAHQRFDIIILSIRLERFQFHLQCSDRWFHYSTRRMIENKIFWSLSKIHLKRCTHLCYAYFDLQQGKSHCCKEIHRKI